MFEHDLKNELADAPTAKEFLRRAWQSSEKNAAARQYIAGALDAMRYSGRITYEEYSAFYEEYVFGRDNQGGGV
ncbi:hypothetical protein Y5S_03686 [Alcanivorax nanhaiticus]|jgi:hypothetical protein|uniref:Uncharacterized protein n=1 Tax=Alcanivorax nanhaiticus TaxID=1177154 RepID=A0A095TGX4_9GAMM|nr:hypothetical protein [Alcanivorax nanhaiticus]KGD61678.1 hypothetical protein Y5S_03686 [Alcanivorax nanhaiticus]MAG53731.1 hypothetical protein [Halomonas sp.]OUW29524.1 MAG: hypothetical protein CBD27_02865 [Rhodospirillaceae bacterium TMED167]|tara:strand:- start:108 stop:329 length:222 start_codon:yes stop_codon:yes gene_type:complete